MNRIGRNRFNIGTNEYYVSNICSFVHNLTLRNMEISTRNEAAILPNSIKNAYFSNYLRVLVTLLTNHTYLVNQLFTSLSRIIYTFANENRIALFLIKELILPANNYNSAIITFRRLQTVWTAVQVERGNNTNCRQGRQR